MRNGRPIQRFCSLAAAAVLALVLCLPALAGAKQSALYDTGAIKVLKSQYKALTGRHKLLLKDQRELLSQQNKLADEIEKLQDSGPGILGRMRLERLLAENMRLSQELNEVAKSLSDNDKARDRKRGAVYRAYSTEMEVTARKMRQTGDRKRATQLAHRFYELRELRWQWRTARTVEADFSRLVVKVSDLDGPKELTAKAQILDDLVRKIRAAIREIDKKIKRLRREKKLGEDFDTMVKEMNLFEEGARFLRRPDEGDRTDPDEAPQADADESGLHVPPLDPTAKMAPGADRADKSIQAEIKRLKHEKALLKKLAGDLAAKAKILRRKADELRARESR